MNSSAKIRTASCPVEEIAAYIDGELDALREREMECHFAACEPCSRELNYQKQFLCSLNASLKEEKDLDLPADFTKLIVANAESTVSGLRRPRERFNAAFICVGLALFILFALGTDSARLFGALTDALDKSAAVAGIVGGLVSSVFLGLAIILRSLASQVDFGALAVLALLIAFAAAFMFAAQKAIRLRRI